MKKLTREFYEQDTLTIARALVGKYLVRIIEDIPFVCQLTEVEAYIGAIDKACHAYNGKRTPRTEILYGDAGYAYVYLIYGMYYCLNIVTEPRDVASAILIRGAKPIVGIDRMAKLRYKKPYSSLTKSQCKHLMDGPGKLCNALGINKETNGIDFTGDSLYITETPPFVEEWYEETVKIEATKRINIDYAEEAVHFPWRFIMK